MANLRTNNLSGEQGQNAYRGSVQFNDADYLQIADSADIEIGSNDYTVEFWAIFTKVSSSTAYEEIVNKGYPFQIYRNTSNNQILLAVDSNTDTYEINTSFGTPEVGHWHHIAVSRSGNTTKGFVNGIGGLSSTSNTSINDGSTAFTIGTYGASTGDYQFRGVISNVRVVIGTALYTADFTPPTEELTIVDGTAILCCQDSNDPTQEATGKTITGFGNLATAGYLETQPKVIPPYGVDAGNAFGGPIQQSSQGYMYFPTGRTEERGRGRAVSWWGIYNTSGNYTKDIDYFDIQSLGNTTKFGDLSDTVGLGAGMSSSTRGVFAGGTKPAVGNMNLLEFITIATTGNAVDFGGVSTTFRYGAGISNSTRGLIAGGYQGGGASGTKNVIQFITIASLGDTADFGDMIADSGGGISGAGSCQSSTRGITFGGAGYNPAQINEINHITIGTLGNSVDFGDLSVAKEYLQGVSSSTRGVVAGGYQDSPGFTSTNVIEFITIASTGDAVDFGDLITAARLPGSSGGSNKIRGVFVGGGVHPSYYNTMEFVTIATTGNASDFGDISTGGGTPYGSVAVSDSHGGLS